MKKEKDQNVFSQNVPSQSLHLSIFQRTQTKFSFHSVHCTEKEQKEAKSSMITSASISVLYFPSIDLSIELSIQLDRKMEDWEEIPDRRSERESRKEEGRKFTSYLYCFPVESCCQRHQL